MVKIVVKFKILKGVEEEYLEALKNAYLRPDRSRTALSIRRSGTAGRMCLRCLNASRTARQRKDILDIRIMPSTSRH